MHLACAAQPLLHLNHVTVIVCCRLLEARRYGIGVSENAGKGSIHAFAKLVLKLVLPSPPVDYPHRVKADVLDGIVSAREDDSRLKLGILDGDILQQDVPVDPPLGRLTGGSGDVWPEQ